MFTLLTGAPSDLQAPSQCFPQNHSHISHLWPHLESTHQKGLLNPAWPGVSMLFLSGLLIFFFSKLSCHSSLIIGCEFDEYDIIHTVGWHVRGCYNSVVLMDMPVLNTASFIYWRSQTMSPLKLISHSFCMFQIIQSSCCDITYTMPYINNINKQIVKYSLVLLYYLHACILNRYDTANDHQVHQVHYIRFKERPSVQATYQPSQLQKLSFTFYITGTNSIMGKTVYALSLCQLV